MEKVRWLSRRELRVWRLLAAVLVVLPDAVEAQLQRDGAITRFGYGVLSTLSEEPGHSMRMSELACMTNGSQSRLSHAMASLERRGWVRREPAADDGRGNIAVLTDAGFAQVKAVAPGHVRTVRKAVFDVLSPGQLDELENVCAALLPAVVRERLLRHHIEDESERPQTEDIGAAVREPSPTDARTRPAAGTPRLGTGAPAAVPDPVDGLAMLSEARREIDFAELELIDRARACGRTWEQIAAALAMPDRRQAQTRYRRLRERWPEYEPPAPDQ